MAQVKCTECGQLFNDDTLNACPNCGYPASECVTIHNETNMDSSNLQTTDTGYKHEKVIQRYAMLLFKWTIIGCIIGWFIALIGIATTVSISGDLGPILLFIILSPLGILPIIFTAYIVRAFLTIYANMSINLHELNMKLK